MPAVSRMHAPQRKATKRAYRRRVGWRHVWTDDGDMPEVAAADRSGRPCITLSCGQAESLERSSGPCANSPIPECNTPRTAASQGTKNHYITADTWLKARSTLWPQSPSNYRRLQKFVVTLGWWASSTNFRSAFPCRPLPILGGPGVGKGLVLTPRDGSFAPLYYCIICMRL
jgi:hypothetical protein